MANGTLLVSRAVKLHPDFKKRLGVLGFRDVSVTAAEKDGLNMLIDELKPRLVIVSSRFYQSATPYMMALLKRKYTSLNIAVVSLCEYPADLGMRFIANGVTSYLDLFDGSEQFYKGIAAIREGGRLFPRR